MYPSSLPQLAGGSRPGGGSRLSPAAETKKTDGCPRSRTGRPSEPQSFDRFTTGGHMSLMDKLMGGVEKAKEGVADFAETARLKRDIGSLNDQKAERFLQIGRDAFALYGQGRVVPELEAHFKEIQVLDAEIKKKAEEITRITIES